MYSTYRSQILTQFFWYEAGERNFLTQTKVRELATRIGGETKATLDRYFLDDIFEFFSPDLTGGPVCDFHRKIGTLEEQHDFMTLRFNLAPENIQALADEMMAERKTAYDLVAKLDEELTFDNTILPIAKVNQELSAVSSSVDFLGGVHEEKDVRDASTEAAKRISKFNVGQTMRTDVYKMIKKYADSDHKEDLTPEKQRLVDRWIRNYERMGLHLEAEKRERIERIKYRISELSITFSKNVTEENSRFAFSKEELEGMPEDFLEGLEKDGQKFVCTLKKPVYYRIMDSCKVIKTRKEMEKAFSSRCMEENIPILEELVRLRDEQARILGFPNFAAYMLDIRMAKTPETVMTFETELSEKLTPLLEEDIATLKALKRGELKDGCDDRIHTYDLRYYSKMRVRTEFSVDDQKIKEYFPLERVLNGILDIYQELLSLEFTSIDITDPTKSWNSDISLFRVNDSQDGRLVGYFYLDLYPRPGKYGHAGAATLRPGCQILSDENVRMYPVSVVLANFSSPTESRPSLLIHKEVITLFHEFGHIMHQLCAEDVQFEEFAGSSVERDFVEAPSKMLEKWCWEKEALMKISGHYKTGERLPDTMLEALIKSKKANVGLLNKRQLLFGIFDQKLHSSPDANTQKLYFELSESITGVSPTEGTNFCGAFGHLATGYAAQYYSYMWSDVFAADMFYSRFKGGKLFNQIVGNSYRDEILAKGSTVDADVLLRSFLGRDPTMDAFFLDKGLSLQ